MITVENQHNAFGSLDKTTFELRGLSTDEKPTTKYKDVLIANGSIFIEMDTQKIWFYDETGATWVGNEEE